MYELEFTLWERYRNIALPLQWGHKRDIQYLAEFTLKTSILRNLKSINFFLFREMYEIGCTFWDRYRNKSLAHISSPQIAKLCESSTTCEVPSATCFENNCDISLNNLGGNI